MQNHVEFYRDKGGQWRWRFLARENGSILATASEGYENYVDCEIAMLRVVGALSSPDGFTVETIHG